MAKPWNAHNPASSAPQTAPQTALPQPALPQPAPLAWIAPATRPPATLQQALLRWEATKQMLARAKEDELIARRQAFALGFGDAAQEGTNTRPLENGFELKGVKKYNYKLCVPDGFEGDIIDAAEQCAERFAKISNEGSYVAARLFKYSVDLSITEYRKLFDEARAEPPKKAMLDELNKILEISEATPTLEIKAPKEKK